MKALVLAVPLLAVAAGAVAECRQALALGLDVSGSVDTPEYRLQLDGLAGALGAPEVREALLRTPGAPVRLTVYEWSGPGFQRTVLPWSEIGSEADIDRAMAQLRAARRQEGELSTAIGTALLAGFARLAQQPQCWTRTLDLSGDGPSNTGPQPRDISRNHRPDGVIVNGLVIGTIPQAGDDRSEDVRQLAAYYEANVIAGVGAFVEVALGFEDYETAMRRKLLRELAVLAIGLAPDEAPEASPARPSRYNGSGRPDNARSGAGNW